MTHLRIATPPPLAGMARKSPLRRRLEVDLRRHLPVARGVLDEALAHALDRLARGDRGEHVGLAERRAARAPPVRYPAREPQRKAASDAPAHRAGGREASPEEAAAIAAAIEQFLRDTAPPPAPPSGRMSPWLRAGLLEATGARGSGGPCSRGAPTEAGLGAGHPAAPSPRWPGRALGRRERRRPPLRPGLRLFQLRCHSQQQVLGARGRRPAALRSAARPRTSAAAVRSPAARSR